MSLYTLKIFDIIHMNRENWANKEFSSINLNDKRLNDRLLLVANQLSMNAVAPINQACGSWKDSKAAYRLFNNNKVSAQKILAAHREMVSKRISSQSLVFVIQDTTYINYTHHRGKRDFGPIGALRDEQNGMMMHTALCVNERSLPLGILSLEYQVRNSESSKKNRHRPIQEKESVKWLNSLEVCHNAIPAGTRAISIGDRESDISELFILAEKISANILIRACRDRCLTDENQYLRAFFKNIEPAGQKIFEVPKIKSRDARKAVLEIKFSKVELRLPWHIVKKHKIKSISMYAVMLKEINCPENCEPLEWLLLTNIPVGSYDEACEKIEWYKKRWMVENFFKILKSGCAVEKCRLETRQRIERYIALSVIIAWRLLWITQIKRLDPNLPCDAIMSPNEWKPLYLFLFKTNDIPKKVPTVSESVVWIARLGGFLARKNDGEPGSIVLWRGWIRFCDIVATWNLKTCG